MSSTFPKQLPPTCNDRPFRAHQPAQPTTPLPKPHLQANKPPSDPRPKTETILHPCTPPHIHSPPTHPLPRLKKPHRKTRPHPPFHPLHQHLRPPHLPRPIIEHEPPHPAHDLHRLPALQADARLAPENDPHGPAAARVHAADVAPRPARLARDQVVQVCDGGEDAGVGGRRGGGAEGGDG